jgi:hypothetical protein
LEKEDWGFFWLHGASCCILLKTVPCGMSTLKMDLCFQSRALQRIV